MAHGWQRCRGHDGQRCGVLVENATRCTVHARSVNRTAMSARRQTRPDLRKDEARRAEVVAQWREARGDWCPGWGRPPHDSADLTADHVHAVGAGGAELGPLTVLCRLCNSRKQHHAA